MQPIFRERRNIIAHFEPRGDGRGSFPPLLGATIGATSMAPRRGWHFLSGEKAERKILRQHTYGLHVIHYLTKTFAKKTKKDDK